MRISVGICTYNGELFIKDQLNSIINQTIRPDEIIIADDNSKDNTVNIAKEVLEESGIDFKIIEHSEHQGIRVNFENVFKQCTGDVIFSCDQDDVWYLNKIETFIPYFECGYSFVYSNSVVVDRDLNIVNDNYWQMYGYDFKNISVDEFRRITLTDRALSGYNMAFTKELLRKMLPFPKHFIHDDWIAICSSWFGKVAFIDKPLVMYRIHGKNTSGFGGSPSTVKERSANVKSNRHVLTRHFISDSYFSVKPDVWFGNAHMYLASEVFYDRMKDNISDDYARKVERFILFRKRLLDILPKHRIKSVCVLMREYAQGRYGEFRGNWKRLLKDLVYISVNENKSFTHNMNIVY